ncbi:tRNA-splicing 2 [Hyphodiscus hymeniophilus]|uniref:tRNA-intron lyase n=1 Tax=Hyphodiscus hymeniophilus TaxID=353542 RepID=A0A9P7AUA6_9HELO|nr:tRNA-splicing 2 [Hyphodiscus hymeniophilus]
MADTTPVQAVQSEAAVTPAAPSSQPKTNRQNVNKLYALPAPLRTFPLPTLVPHNPLSLFQILYVWLSQTINPPSSHFETPYYGLWSPETRSVHVTDSRSIRGLWEQGFYGKGSLSRSEPNWMSGQKARRENKGKVTSEEVTRQRRAARQQTKWERARKEREAIEQKLLEEAEAARVSDTTNNGDSASTGEEGLFESDTSVTVSDVCEDSSVEKYMEWQSPVGPLELLSLPNSTLDLAKASLNLTRAVEQDVATVSDPVSFMGSNAAPVGPLQILALPNSRLERSFNEALLSEGGNEIVTATHHSLKEDSKDSFLKSRSNENGAAIGHGLNGHATATKPYMNGHSSITEGAINGSAHSDGTAYTSNFLPNGSAISASTPMMKRRKSVRFSPTVEKNTFIQNEPLSPEHASLITTIIADEAEPAKTEEQEHFQLTLEEAFFLAYSLGALTILDPVTKSPISNKDLFKVFRRSSYFPPLTNASFAPDDPFMLNYVVYHHFRSLGWVVRGGVKFAVDFMLYNRGPVFSHAEFAVVILPSYSDPYWSSDVSLQNYVKGKEKRTWAWFHCINRVITQVRKTLVLVYVDIPSPLNDGDEEDIGVDGVLARYKVREVVMQRWLSNRQRD